jgi:hypothetical protein
MSSTVQWALIVLAALGAAGTWVRAIVAWKEHRSAERMRNWSQYQ